MTNEVLFTTETPSGEATDGAPGLDLGTLFWLEESKPCVGIQVWAAAGLASVTAGLYENVSETLLASATLAAPAHGFVNVLFDAPVTLDPNVTYIATYHTPAAYAATASFWDNPLDSPTGLIHGAQSGVDVPNVDGETLRNGRLNGGTSVLTYPASPSGNHACYFVGPIMQLTEPPPETHHGSAAIALTVSPTSAGHKAGHGNAHLTTGLALFGLAHKTGFGAAAFGLAVRLASPSLRLIHGHLTAGGRGRASLAPAGRPTSTLTAEGE